MTDPTIEINTLNDVGGKCLIHAPQNRCQNIMACHNNLICHLVNRFSGNITANNNCFKSNTNTCKF